MTLIGVCSRRRCVASVCRSEWNPWRCWVRNSIPAARPPMPDNVIQMVVVAERTKRRLELEEDLSVFHSRPAKPQIVDQRFSDLFGDGQREGRPVLACATVTVDASQSRSSSFNLRRSPTRKPSREASNSIA